MQIKATGLYKTKHAIIQGNIGPFSTHIQLLVSIILLPMYPSQQSPFSSTSAAALMPTSVQMI